MAMPTDFEGANKIYAAPPNMPNCRDLATFADGSHIVSAWVLSPEELEKIQETGIIWLSITGSGMPPVSISGFPFIQIEGREPRVEPLLPSPGEGKG